MITGFFIMVEQFLSQDSSLFRFVAHQASVTGGVHFIPFVSALNFCLRGNDWRRFQTGFAGR
jgi:hypothetical protein